jgi:hypothetical protein
MIFSPESLVNVTLCSILHWKKQECPRRLTDEGISIEERRVPAKQATPMIFNVDCGSKTTDRSDPQFRKQALSSEVTVRGMIIEVRAHSVKHESKIVSTTEGCEKMKRSSEGD